MYRSVSFRAYSGPTNAYPGMQYMQSYKVLFMFTPFGGSPSRILKSEPPRGTTMEPMGRL